MAENRITKKWLKNHWHYSWWKYMVLAMVCILSVTLLFTTTAYRAPEEKKIELYVTNGYVDAVALRERLAEPYFARLPEQEELTVMNVNLSQNDMYAQMQFTTYIAAQQGDVLLLPKGEVYKYADSGADNLFLELTPYIEAGLIDMELINAEPLVLKDSQGVEGIYAIPADSLYGLFDLGNDPKDSYLCITNYSGNEESAACVLNLLFELYQTQKPADYDRKTQPAAGSAVF